jgi:hypothetical protein
MRRPSPSRHTVRRRRGTGASARTTRGYQTDAQSRPAHRAVRERQRCNHRVGYPTRPESGRAESMALLKPLLSDMFHQSC